LTWSNKVQKNLISYIDICPKQRVFFGVSNIGGKKYPQKSQGEGYTTKV